MDTIDFLERMGQDAGLRDASDVVLSAALEQARVEPLARAAILGRDGDALQAMAGKGAMYAVLMIGDQDP